VIAGRAVLAVVTADIAESVYLVAFLSSAAASSSSTHALNRDGCLQHRSEDVNERDPASAGFLFACDVDVGAFEVQRVRYGCT
jgi:hypothetical protein